MFGLNGDISAAINSDVFIGGAIEWRKACFVICG
jgi:hypothetical protein